MTPKRILIADELPVVRAGLAAAVNRRPDLQLVGEASNSAETLRMCERLIPDLIMVDIALEVGMNGIELVKLLRSRFPTMGILVLSMHDENLYGERALAAGANGYLMKRVPLERFLDAIDRVLGGRLYASSELVERMLQRSGSRSRSQLSDREVEVLELIGRGLGTRDIALALNLSIKTIETYRAHLKSKLAIDTAPQLVRYAVQWLETR